MSPHRKLKATVRVEASAVNGAWQYRYWFTLNRDSQSGIRCVRLGYPLDDKIRPVSAPDGWQAVHAVWLYFAGREATGAEEIGPFIFESRRTPGPAPIMIEGSQPDFQGDEEFSGSARIQLFEGDGPITVERSELSLFAIGPVFEPGATADDVREYLARLTEFPEFERLKAVLAYEGTGVNAQAKCSSPHSEGAGSHNSRSAPSTARNIFSTCSQSFSPFLLWRNRGLPISLSSALRRSLGKAAGLPQSRERRCVGEGSLRLDPGLASSLRIMNLT